MRSYFDWFGLCCKWLCVCNIGNKETMAVTETGRICRRKNAMANIFTGIDITDIEYLASIAASSSTSLVPNSDLSGSSTVQNSYNVASLNCDDASNHQTDDDDDDNESQDRWSLIIFSFFSKPSVNIRSSLSTVCTCCSLSMDRVCVGEFIANFNESYCVVPNSFSLFIDALLLPSLSSAIHPLQSTLFGAVAVRNFLCCKPTQNCSSNSVTNCLHYFASRHV